MLTVQAKKQSAESNEMLIKSPCTQDASWFADLGGVFCIPNQVVKVSDTRWGNCQNRFRDSCRFRVLGGMQWGRRSAVTRRASCSPECHHGGLKTTEIAKSPGASQSSFILLERSEEEGRKGKKWVRKFLKLKCQFSAIFQDTLKRVLSLSYPAWELACCFLAPCVTLLTRKQKNRSQCDYSEGKIRESSHLLTYKQILSLKVLTQVWLLTAQANKEARLMERKMCFILSA